MRRGHGSLYDIAVPGYKANLSDVLAAIALCQLDKLERHREIRAAQSRPTTRGSRTSTGSSRSRGIRGTRTRSTSTSSGSTRSRPARAATRTSER